MCGPAPWGRQDLPGESPPPPLDKLLSEPPGEGWVMLRARISYIPGAPPPEELVDELAASAGEGARARLLEGDQLEILSGGLGRDIGTMKTGKLYSNRNLHRWMRTLLERTLLPLQERLPLVGVRFERER